MQIADNSTHFLEELTAFRNQFDICDDFVFFFNEVCDLVKSPEMPLHNLPKVIDIIVYHISIPDSQAIDSILKLVSVLSRDMRLMALSFL